MTSVATSKKSVNYKRKTAKIRNQYKQAPHLTQKTGHRGYPGKGITEDNCLLNPEELNNKSIK